MSSEESDDADDSTIIVKPLPWRSEKVTDFFQKLDSLGSEEKQVRLSDRGDSV